MARISAQIERLVPSMAEDVRAEKAFEMAVKKVDAKLARRNALPPPPARPVLVENRMEDVKVVKEADRADFNTAISIKHINQI